MHGRKCNVLTIIHVAALLASCSVIEVQADNFLRSNPGSTNIKRADTSDLISSKTIPTNGSTPPGEIHRYMVKYKPNSMEYKTRLSNARRKMTASRRSLKVSGADTMFIPQDDIEVMNFESEAEVMEWKNKPDVEVVVRDTKVFPNGEEVSYGLANINALSVTDAFVENRKVCIIDSGYDITHSDLPSNSNGGDVTGSTGDAGRWDQDDDGHGTHVAGIIAAIGGNDQGVVGVNRNGKLKLHIVRVFNGDKEWAWGSDLMVAVEECVAAKANIVNMSLGGPSFNLLESQLYTRLLAEEDILLVASCGNEGDDTLVYPAAYSAVMSVTALDENNEHAAFANSNSQVEIAASGVAILSTTPGNTYTLFTGTSMAAPHVSGAAALIWSHFPTKTATEIREVLIGSTLDLGDPGRDKKYGYGLLQVDKAYERLGGLFPTPSPTKTPTHYPTNSPTILPTKLPTGSPIYSPSTAPTATPSVSPSSAPTTSTTNTPSKTPSTSPSSAPTKPTTKSPSPAPSTSPSSTPTTPITEPPSAMPSTPLPTKSPTISPSASTKPSLSPTVTCFDLPRNWHDNFGALYNCDYYRINNECFIFGNSAIGLGGKTASEACCACDGGVHTASITSPPTESPTSSPTRSPTIKEFNSPSLTCVDDPPNWHDGVNEAYNCKYYQDNDECIILGDRFPGTDNKTASEACCTCGGGIE